MRIDIHAGLSHLLRFSIKCAAAQKLILSKLRQRIPMNPARHSFLK
ncbi:hypothetical protein BCEP4_2090002 [Burkholderia cepacia]|nr:hypothetical protein BCEP4_2090002 [Burkholderia cepacia]